MCYFVTSQTSSSATTQKNTVEKIEGFPLKAKSFQNTATYKKLKGGGDPLTHPLYHRGRMTLSVHL